MGFTSLLLGEGHNQKSEVESFASCSGTVFLPCMMHQCTVLLKDEIVSRNMFDSS